MPRTTGAYSISTTLGESVHAFVPHPLPPAAPPLSSADHSQLNREAELALARLAGVAGLVPSVDWLLYNAIRKEALLASQIESTQATLTGLTCSMMERRVGGMVASRLALLNRLWSANWVKMRVSEGGCGVAISRY